MQRTDAQPSSQRDDLVVVHGIPFQQLSTIACSGFLSLAGGLWKQRMRKSKTETLQATPLPSSCSL